jgi:hypothetical protein
MDRKRVEGKQKIEGQKRTERKEDMQKRFCPPLAYSGSMKEEKTSVKVVS